MTQRNQWRAAALLAVAVGTAAAGPLSDKSTADDVLDVMQARGADVRSFTADLAQDQQDLQQGTDVTYRGRVSFASKPGGDARLRLTLDTKQVGKGPVTADKKDYLLDDGWLTDRDSRIKTETRRQLAPPGQKVDLFQLGKGTFPLPIGQDKGQVLRLFDVQREPADKDDPPQSVHLRLTPKAGTPFAQKFKTVDFWVDTHQRMPVRIETVDAQGVMDQTNDLTNVRINPPPQPGDFTLPPLPPNWSTTDTPLPP